jgi:hypothetical protein
VVSLSGRKSIAIEPDDWQTLGDIELVLRACADETLSLAKSSWKLYPFYNSVGDIVGRIGLSDWRVPSLKLATKGIFSGSQHGFTGVLSAGAPLNAARTKAIVAVGLAEWRDWAKRVLMDSEQDSEPALKEEHLVLLNRLLPERNMALFTFRERTLTLDQLSGQILTLEELAIHSDEFEFDEDRDSVTKPDFQRYVRHAKNVVFLPTQNTLPSLLEPLNLAEIDYEWQVRSSIENAWKDFEESQEEFVVATVNGEEITRDIVVFRRNIDS